MPTDPPLPPPLPAPAAGRGVDNETTDAEHATSRTPRPDTLIGKVLDQRYKILGLIARGGMGRVYRAEQAPMGRLVAVKVLDVGLEHDEDQEFRTRFIKEAEASARLTHPNTVRVFDYGKTWDDVLYIAMEHLEGRNLYQALQTDAPMDARRVVRIGRQIAASLREAHGLGLIHRDLKPSNIILTRPGGDEEFVKVVDFGLVKEIRSDAELTRDDALVGSPSYMSPEQIRSAALDERSDIYSLGVLLYACMTGRAPFTGATSLNVLMGHLNQPPPPMQSVCPSMKRAPALEAVVLRCLAKAPSDRYESMDAVLKALQACEDALRGPIGTEPTFVAPPTPVQGPEVVGRGGQPPRNAPPASAGTQAPRAASASAGPTSEVSLVLPRPGPSAALVAGIGVAAVLFLVGVAAVAAWVVLGGVGEDAAETAPASTVEAAPASVGPSPADAGPGSRPSTPTGRGNPSSPSPGAAAPTSEAATSPASEAAPASADTRAPSGEAPVPDAPSRAPRRARAAATAAATATEPPTASVASPQAPAHDTPPSPAPAPVPEPRPAGAKVGSDVRDPWEQR